MKGVIVPRNYIHGSLDYNDSVDLSPPKLLSLGGFGNMNNTQ